MRLGGLPQTSPSKGKGQALILSVQGSLDRSEFFSHTGAKVRNSPLAEPLVIKSLQAAFYSVRFCWLGHRTFVPVKESFAEASSALPQIAPVPLPSSGLRICEGVTQWMPRFDGSGYVVVSQPWVVDEEA